MLHRVRPRGGRPDAAGLPTAASPPWHALPIEEVARALGLADPAAGLSSDEAARVLRRVGPNALAGIEPRSPLELLAGQLFTVPTALLAGAGALSLLLGDVLEAGAILLVVGSNAAIGYFTEARAEELLHAWADLRVERARVVRDGVEVSLPAAEVVPGDVLVLRAGDEIAADARVVEARELAADESTLTGESEPAEKDPAPAPEAAALADRRGMVHAGTVVSAGEGRAIVVGTGQRTEFGAVPRALARAGERAAPLERELDDIGEKLAASAAASSIAVVAIGLLRRRPLAALARSAVALGVAAIPEGFPAVGTTALALASRRLHRRGIVIRRLAAAETLGAVSVVCADKTGTLTENRMSVAEIFLPDQGLLRVLDTALNARGLRADEPRCAPELPARTAGHGHLFTTEAGAPVDRVRARALARIAALNADVDVTDAGQVTRGSGTERALVELAVAAGYPVLERRRAARRVGEERRAAGRAFMTTIHEHPELGEIELVKGAPEQVVALCRDLDPAAAAEALRQNAAMASRGLRVLAFAWRHDGRPGNPAPLAFAGLVGLRDPPRPGVREALRALSGAGMDALMLTGDQERTALAIGAALGFPRDAIRSRVTPEAKLDVIRALQAEGRIVAMTGDGVNDGPALKAADVGVAMGRRGTDIARAVADVVLADDDLPSLVEAVREGRRLHDNVRRAIAYFVATNASEVLVMLAGALAGLEPLGPLQLLWINLLTDVAPALALALEPAEPDVMRRPPRDPAAPLFGPEARRRLVADAARMAAASLSAYALGAATSGARGRLPAPCAPIPGTMAFTALVVAQLLHVEACRAPAAREDNPHVARALACSFALQALALTSPTLRRALGVARLAAPDLALAAALGAAPSLLSGRRGLLARDLIVARAPAGATAAPRLAQHPTEDTAP
ncbi:MAG: cation-transporting P-type ATPase [Polyangiaceae bacterium]|nr:cation-transporting P-type ATPase [Polyangiaceae bacterium]